MAKFFVPFSGDCPAAIEIKGHRLLFVATSKSDLRNTRSLLGSDDVRELFLFDSEEADVLADLARRANGGIVLTPPGMPLDTMISNLEQDLPWLH